MAMRARNWVTALLMVAAIWPLWLQVAALQAPGGAVDHVLAARWLLRQAALVLFVAGPLLLLLHPVAWPRLRQFAAGMRKAMRRDRLPLHRAMAELQNFESAQRRFEAGRAALTIDEPDLALLHLARAVELDAQHAGARHHFGIALLARGRHGEALAQFAAALALDDQHAFGDARRLAGRAAMLAGEAAAARQHLEQHRAQFGGSRESLFWLGQVLLEAGDREAARDALAAAARPRQQAERLPPDEAVAAARARLLLRRVG